MLMCSTMHKFYLHSVVCIVLAREGTDVWASSSHILVYSKHDLVYQRALQDLLFVVSLSCLPVPVMTQT